MYKRLLFLFILIITVTTFSIPVFAAPISGTIPVDDVYTDYVFIETNSQGKLLFLFGGDVTLVRLDGFYLSGTVDAIRAFNYGSETIPMRMYYVNSDNTLSGLYEQAAIGAGTYYTLNSLISVYQSTFDVVNEDNSVFFLVPTLLVEEVEQLLPIMATQTPLLMKVGLVAFSMLLSVHLLIRWRKRLVHL